MGAAAAAAALNCSSHKTKEMSPPGVCIWGKNSIDVELQLFGHRAPRTHVSLRGECPLAEPVPPAKLAPLVETKTNHMYHFENYYENFTRKIIITRDWKLVKVSTALP